MPPMRPHGGHDSRVAARHRDDRRAPRARRVRATDALPLVPGQPARREHGGRGVYSPAHLARRAGPPPRRPQEGREAMTTDPRITQAEEAYRESRAAWWRNEARDNLRLGLLDWARFCEARASDMEWGVPTCES